jgi:hypothetical protein
MQRLKFLFWRSDRREKFQFVVADAKSDTRQFCSKVFNLGCALSISMRLRSQFAFPNRTPRIVRRVIRGTAACGGAHPSNCNEGRIVTCVQRQQNESAGADHIEPTSRQSHCVPGF